MRTRLFLMAVMATMLMGGFVPVYSDTIAARLPGTVGLNWSLYDSQFLGTSWSQGSATNESISAYLFGTGDFGFQLTTAIGPSATASDLIASTTLTIDQSVAFLQIFGGLNLAANTYYLTAYVIDDLSGGAWPELVGPTEVGALGEEFFVNDAGLNASDPFRSEMVLSVLSMGLLVEGDHSAVPEPASLMLLGTGLGVLGLAAWRKRR